VLPEELTVPTPWLIDTDVAFDTFQLRVVELPRLIMDGVATKELITGKPVVVGGDVVPETITCVVAVMLPAALEAVRV
jgi:hypothetical protein